MYATITSWRYMAALAGVEPTTTESKSGELPLLYRAIYLPAELANRAAVEFLIIPVALIDRLIALGADEKTILPINVNTILFLAIASNFFPTTHFNLPLSLSYIYIIL